MLRAIDHALTGIADGFARLDRAAAHIAHHGAADDLAHDALELMRAGQAVRANAAVIRTEDAMIGSLLDVLA